MHNTSLLFGNGINRLTDTNISWGKLLDLLMQERRFDAKVLPNTFTYERIILESPKQSEDITHDEEGVKHKIAELLSSISPNKVYEDLFGLPFKNYLTTNYDYGFLKSIKSKHPDLRVEDSSTEKIYSLRRMKELTLNNGSHFLWHIHGEIDRPPSIMLGLDHYSGSIGKINNYIKGFYEYQLHGEEVRESSIGDKFENGLFKNSSWIDLFFTSNIHIVGYSFDHSEIDLWWVLNKRARMIRGKRLSSIIKNQIFFHYIDSDYHMEELGLFKALGVIPVTHMVGAKNDPSRFLKYYHSVLDYLHSNLKR
ncbi:MAG: SIR2 family protein [Flavobacteriales bacterium]